MSTSIDKRVVEMKFENDQFEQGIKTSMSSLDKLKGLLDFKKTSKALEEFQSVSSHFSLDDIGASVDKIADRFGVLGEIAMQVRQKIANMFLEIPTRVAETVYSMSSMGQLGEGFTKFGQKTNSVGTMLAQGFSLDEVNEQISKLTWFADETSYSLTDMTENVAKFTATGQGLEDSADALQGIALWAALSGQNAQKASSAMYQLSQALGSGQMRKEDYKSIQNLSMDTDEFRQIALDTAIAVGTLTKTEDGLYKSLVGGKEAFSKSQFADHLTEDAWFTTDVMMGVYRKYASAVNQIYEYTEEHGVTASEAIKALGDTVDVFGMKAFKAGQEARTWEDVVGSVQDAVSSQWLTSYEYIFGNYEQVKELWTQLANDLWDVFAGGGEIRNSILENWNLLGGRDDLLAGFWDLFYGVQDVMNAISEAIREVFFFGSLNDEDSDWDGVIAKRAERLASFTKTFKEFAEKIRPSEKALTGLRNTFKGLFSVVGLVVDVFKAVGKGIVDIVKYIMPSGDFLGGILSVTGGVGEMIFKFRQWVNESGVLTTAVGKVVDVVKKGVDFIRDKLDVFVSWVTPKWESIKEALGDFGTFLGDKLPSVKTAITNFFSTIKDFFRTQGESASETAGDIWSKMSEGFTKFADKVKEIWAKISPFINTLLNEIKEMAGAIWDSLKGVFDGSGDISNVMDAVNTFFSIGIFAGIKTLIDKFKELKDDAGGFLEAGVDALEGLQGVLSAYQTNLKADTLLKIAEAVGVLAASLLVVSLIDSEKLTNAALAIGGLMTALVAANIAMSNFGNTGGITTLFGKDGLSLSKAGSNFGNLIGMAAAVMVLATAAAKLGQLDAGAVEQGVSAVSLLISEMVVAMQLLKTNFSGKFASGSFESDATNMVKTAITLVAFAFAVKKLAGAVEDIGKMRWQDGLKGTLAVMGLMVTLGLTMNKANIDLSKGAGFTAMAGGIVIMAQAAKTLAGVKTNDLIKAVSSMELLLVTMGAIGAYAGDAEHLTALGFSFVEMAGAIVILTTAVGMLGSMNLNTLVQGLGAVTVALVEFYAVLTAMPDDSKTKATSILAIAAALIPLSVSLKLLGTMNLGAIAASLGALAGAFVIFGAAAKLIKADEAMTLLTMAKGVALFGVGVAAVGVGLAFFASGLAGIAVSGSAAAVAIGAIGSAIIMLIPLLAKAAAAAIISFAETLRDGAPILIDAVVEIALSAMEGLKEVVPAAVELVLTILESTLESLATHIGPIADHLITIIVDVIHVVASRMPEIMMAVVELVGGFLDGLAQVFEALTPEKLAELILGITMLVGMFKIIAEASIDIKTAAVTIGLMLVLVAGISACFYALQDVDGVNALAQATSISEVMLAMAGVIKLLQGIPITSALKAIAEMDLMVANMAIVLAAMGGLSRIDGLSELINDGAAFLTDLGKGIGGFVGAIIGGIGAGISDSFPTIADNLAEFGKRVQPFLESMSGVTKETTDGISNLTGALLKLTAAELLDGLAKFVGGANLASFGQQLEDFAPHLKAFYDSTKGIDADVVDVAGRAASVVAEFANKVPRTGGWLQKITGENDIVQFGEQIVAFGPSLKEFADSVKGVSSDDVQVASDAASIVAEFAKKVPKSGGWLQAITGENDIALFGEQIAKFAPHLVEYANTVSGLDTIAVSMSSTAAGMLVDLATELPKTGGLQSFLTGDQDISEFGSALETFGTSLKNYSQSVTGLNPYSIANSVTAAQSLVDLSGQLNDWLDISYSLGDFGGQIETFGANLQTYWGEISNITPSTLGAVTDEISRLADVAKGITGDGMKNFGDGLKSIGESGLQNFVSSIENGAGKLQSAATKMMTTFISAVESKKALATVAFGAIVTAILEDFNKFSVSFLGSGTKLAQSFVDGIKLKTTAISTSFTNTISTTLTTINSKGTSFQTAGSGLISKLIDGIKSKSAAAKTEMTQIVNTIATAVTGKYSTFITLGQNLMSNFISGIRSNNGASYAFTSGMSGAVGQARGYYTSFYNAGYYLVQGFANGIDKNTWRAKAKAIAMAQAALDGANSRLRINSPSKETFQTGYYTAMGLVNALVKFSRNVYDAGYDMASSAMSGLQSAISTVGSMIDNALDAEPTIRPIMDLSEIQNGTNRLANMMSAVDGFEVNGSVGIASMTAATIKNAKIATEVDPTMAAFDDLKAALSGMSGNTTYENTFNITGDNPREIANEVSRIMQMQVERRAASWA